MTLKEAIEHYKEVSETCSNTECAKEHLQLVTWLKELQFYRDKYQKSNKTMELIDKGALVAEIDRQIELLKPFLGACAGQIVAEANDKLSVLEGLKIFLDTLEVKYLQEESVSKDLEEKTLHSELRKIYTSIYDSKDIKSAKHFFELGLKAQKEQEPERRNPYSSQIDTDTCWDDGNF